jgi:hypothetical protein
MYASIPLSSVGIPIAPAGKKAVFTQSVVLLMWRSYQYLLHCIVIEYKISIQFNLYWSFGPLLWQYDKSIKC